jgi:hypothetical protein
MSTRKIVVTLTAIAVCALLLITLFGCQPPDRAGEHSPGSDQRIATAPGDRRIVLHVEVEDPAGASIARTVTIHVIGVDKAGRIMVPRSGGLGVPGPDVVMATAEDWVPIDVDPGAVRLTITVTEFARTPGERLIVRAYRDSRTGWEVAGSYREMRNTSGPGVVRVLTTAPAIVIELT